MSKTEETVTTKYTIYVGLSDGETYAQKFDTEKYIRVIQNACKGYKLAFTLSQNYGGYTYKNGTYVQQNSLVITLIGAEESVIEGIASDLCAFFNQESVLVEKQQVESYYISEQI